MITSSGRQELKAILDYLASVRSAWIIWDSMWENKSVVCSHCSSEEKQDGQDDSEGKGTWIFNFKTWNVHGGRRELIPRNSLLSSACTYTMSSSIYAHTHQIISVKYKRIIDFPYFVSQTMQLEVIIFIAMHQGYVIRTEHLWASPWWQSYKTECSISDWAIFGNSYSWAMIDPGSQAQSMTQDCLEGTPPWPLSLLYSTMKLLGMYWCSIWKVGWQDLSMCELRSTVGHCLWGH